MKQAGLQFSTQRAVDSVAVVVMVAAMTLACALPFAKTAFGAEPAKAGCRDLLSTYLDAHRAAAFSLDDARRMGNTEIGRRGPLAQATWSQVCPAPNR